jgi:hypothetical protein
MDKLIVQLPIDAGTDFDGLIEIEEALIRALSTNRTAEVDGHDIGEGKFNVFVHLRKGWEPALTQIVEALNELDLLPRAIVAKFHGAVESYEVVRPDSFAGTFTL